MATAGEGATSYESGGAGGKFRKKPFRRPQTTPYDRPPTALRNPSTNGWLSKLVDPASKLISASAHMFFSSVFRKRLPPLPQPSSEANQERRNRLQEAVPNNCIGASELAIDGGGNLANSSDGSGISELEQILTQKTFTRSEIDRLTGVLRSRTVESPVGDEDIRTEANLSKTVSDLGRHEGFISSPVQECRNKKDKFAGIISTPVVSSSRVLEEDVASPAELAKAYMGSRPSKVSLSMLGLHSRALREDATLPSNAVFPSKSPIMSVASKTSVHVGVPENGFMTPRSRGRSAIYNMARTPYSRVHPNSTQKATGSTNYGFRGPSTSSSYQSAWENDGPFWSKQVALKRRNSVLDEDIGSVGAIRRIRQKPNLLSQGSPRNGVRSNAAPQCISSTQKPLLLDEAKHKDSNTLEENGDNSFPSTGYARVPSKSSEMATKIFQHLEKLTPKEKSSESKLGGAREKSPTKLTPNMLSGLALRSLEDVESLKLMQNAQDSNKLDDSRKAWLPDARDSTSQRQDKAEESVPQKFSIPCEMLTSVKDTVPNVNTADSVVSKFAAQSPQKRQAFQMSAHEDFLEVDDDIYANGLAFTPLAEGLETSVVKSTAVSTEAIVLDKTPVLPEVKAPTVAVLNKRTDLETYDVSVICVEHTGFTFPTAPAPRTTFEPADRNQSTSTADKIVPPEDPTVSPFFFASKNVDKVPPSLFTSSSAANEYLRLKSDPLSDLKLGSSNSLATTDAQLKILESDKGDNKNTMKAGDNWGNSETLPSAASTSTSTSGIFSFGALAQNSNLNDGSLASNSSVCTSAAPVLASSKFSNETFRNNSTHALSSKITSMTSTATTTAEGSALSVSAAAPTFPTAPVSNFESALTTSTPLSIVSTTSGAETTDTKAETENETTCGNVASSAFGGTSFAMPSTRSSLFGSSSSVTTSTANNQFQGSLFGTSSGTLVSAQVSPSGTGVATVTMSMPIQFGTSGSSPVFGTPGITSFTSGSSLFGSLDLAAKPFSSGTSSGLSFSNSSSQTNSVSSTSGVTSSPFESSWRPKSPIFGSAFSSPSPSTGFSFGASSTSVSATNSLPMVFGSSTGASSSSMFSFTSAVATTSPLPSPSQVQPVFGNSTPVFTATSSNSDQMNMEDSMAEDPVQASTPAVPVFGQAPVTLPQAGFMFGSTAQPPSLPFQFGGQQNQAAPQNPSPFQASSSLEFSAGGSFSLGLSGVDKSNRRMVRVSKNRNRKK